MTEGWKLRDVLLLIIFGLLAGGVYGLYRKGGEGAVAGLITVAIAEALFFAAESRPLGHPYRTVSYFFLFAVIGMFLLGGPFTGIEVALLLGFLALLLADQL